MAETTLQAAVPSPLTSLTEDEILFRDNIHQFAEDKVRPLVKEMDEKGVFDKGLIQQFFELGLMGIEVPEQYGGGSGKFFEAILAVEELSRLADQYLLKQSFEKAIETYQRALELDPQNSPIHKNLVVTYLQSGNISEAVKQCCKDLEVSDDNICRCS